MFPGFPRLSEMNPMFPERFERGIPKHPMYPANLPPHLMPWLISSQIQNLVHHQQASRGEINRGSLYENCNGGLISEDKDQQPLDLSAKKQDAKLMSEEDLVARVLEIKPSTRGRRRADSSKRSYTDFELHAALREIQSGKLGTRKAAVKYGIPRSTLRNKVYKLQLVRDSNRAIIEAREKLPNILPDSTAGVPSALMRTETPVSDADGLSEIPSDALKTIRNNMTQKLEELSRNNQTYLSGCDKQKLLDSALIHLMDNIPKLALNPDNKSTPSEILSSLSLYPQLHEFTHRIVEDRFYEELKKISSNTSNPKLQEVSNGYNADPVNSSISIPTYSSLYKCLPTDSTVRKEEIKSDSSHPSIASPPQANLKDMIAQIINQKILGEDVPAELSASSPSTPFLPLSVQRMETSFLKTDVKLPAEERSQQQDQNKKRAKSPSNSGGKGSRPKRGKYRNYDRDNLLKAVQAVQSGEMSVHRAGSFYGVPHSTLEYKVKERHLNRGKNKKDSGVVANVPLLKSEKENSSFSTVLASSTFSRDYKTDTPDTTTKDLSASENRSNDEISIISVQSPVSKKSKFSGEHEEPFSSLPISSTPFLSNPFPFWNNASPILAPFLSSPYQTDPLYASQVMSNFQRAASNLNRSESRNSSPSPNHSDSKYHSESVSAEGSNKTTGLFSNGGSTPSTPPSSPPMNEGLLNTLLRKKMETHLSENNLPWQMPPSDISTDAVKDQKSNLESIVVPPPGLFTLKALLPSFIAARTSLATAFNTDTPIPNVSKLTTTAPQSVSSAPLITGSSNNIPIVGACGATVSETP